MHGGLLRGAAGSLRCGAAEPRRRLGTRPWIEGLHERASAVRIRAYYHLALQSDAGFVKGV